MEYEHSNSYLAHHGVKGQKWGVRRYQNEDGTLTAEGKERYDRDGIWATNYDNRVANEQTYRIRKQLRSDRKELSGTYRSGNISKNEYEDRDRGIVEEAGKKYNEVLDDYQRKVYKGMQKGKAKTINTIEGIAGLSLAAIGAVMRYQSVKAGDEVLQAIGALGMEELGLIFAGRSILRSRVAKIGQIKEEGDKISQNSDR